MAKKPVTAEAPAEAIPTDPHEKRTYVVTDKAPSRVAGRRVAIGEKVELTEYEARAELQQLHILPEGEELGTESAIEPASSEA